ncbi:MAG: hypothetical protein SGI73_04720 [Chloroflexota bacterium]|nr:hypothetical protein [Chloroflexota bacterium]
MNAQIPNEARYFVEVFPIRAENLPPLFAYRIRLTTDDAEAQLQARAFAGKLAYRLHVGLSGDWVWVGGRLITNKPTDPVTVRGLIAAARAEQPKLYHLLESIEIDLDWKSNADVIARYVVRGLIPPLETQIDTALTSTTFALKHARVEREYRVLPHIVDAQAALSLSVISRVVYAKSIAEYVAQQGKSTALIGLWTADASSRLQGEIVKIVGQAREHRARLIALSQRESMRATLAAAPDDALVLRIEVGGNEYDYIADALQLLVRLEDVHRFDVPSAQVEKALHLKPAMRANIVKLVSDVVKNAGLIASAYSVQNAPERFSSGVRDLNLVFGGMSGRTYTPDSIIPNVRQYGDYWRPDRFKDEPIRAVLINTLSEGVPDFIEALRRAMERDFNIRLEVVRERNMRVITQANLDSAVRLVQKETFDLALVFLADEVGAPDEDSVETGYAKAQTIGRAIPCLTIHESTLNKPEVMPNIILGIMARAGCVPYLIEDVQGGMPTYADLVIGLDMIAHRHKDKDWLTGIARIFRPDGALLRCITAAAPAPHHVVPDALLTHLLPNDAIGGKRVVLHHDGALNRDTLRALGGWEAEIDATFYPVEIIRHGVPRLYALQGNRIDPAPRGTIFRLNDVEAFVLTSSSPFDATPQPLHIRADAAFGIETAVRSVLDFTLLHYGALKPPKLPVTMHNGSFIAGGVHRGLFPDDYDGSMPFWL